MSKIEFIKHYNVSHETLKKLSMYVDILLKWNIKINLISKNSIDSIWIRHILDSAQLMPYIKKTDKILDIGSGAGFPGIILSILGVEDIILLDSDQRKCSFLLEVVRLLNLNLTVINDRVSNIYSKKFDIITSRGFAPINKILEEVSSINTDRILLLKGRNYNIEIQEALQSYVFECITYRSITDYNSYIVDITNVRKK